MKEFTVTGVRTGSESLPLTTFLSEGLASKIRDGTRSVLAQSASMGSRWVSELYSEHFHATRLQIAYKADTI